MRERPMTKMFKRLAAALAAAMLAAVLAAAPSSAHPLESHASRWVPASEVAASGLQFSNDGGSTWTATLQEYNTGEADAGGDNRDGSIAGTYRYRAVLEVSLDGGSTWMDWSVSDTDVTRQYNVAEREDNRDGPIAGQARVRASHEGDYSNDGGLTWRRGAQFTYVNGEADAGGDNGDGPTAGTHRYRYTGPDGALLTTYTCTHSTGHPPGGDWTLSTRSDNDGTIWELRGTVLDVPSCAVRPVVQGVIKRTFTWNVDDRIEPPGDWCVTGRALADGRSLICRGEGYTYREARRELGFGLGRP